jgi:transposase
MSESRRRDAKIEALREQGALNPRPQQVRDPLFLEHDFFDARDLVQVKYEMVRRVESEGMSVTDAAEAFGLSRPTFYQAQTTLHAEGLSGLLPKKRGPRGAHKLSPEVVAFVERTMAESSSLRPEEIVEPIEKRFGIRVHARSIERALERREKKLR